MKKLLFVIMLMLGISIVFSSCGNPKCAIEGYEWLEGEWVGYSGYSDEDDWGKIIIAPNSYKMVYSYTNNSLEEIDTAEELPIAIKQVENYITGTDVLALDKENSLIGIDVPSQRVYIILGEYSCLYLEKNSESNVAGNNSGEASSESVPQESTVPISFDFIKSYGREDDNLKGSVKRVDETFQSESGSSWFITKEYDSLGRISYFKRGGTDANVLSTVLPKGFPNPKKMGGIDYSAFNEYGRYLNPVHMLGYEAYRDERYFAEGVFAFDYDEKGLVNNIYYNNQLINKCEYDEYGRLTTRYENDLPTLKIIWDENAESPTRASFEIRLYRTDGSSLKTFLGTWTRNVLKIEEEIYDGAYADPREYTFVGNELKDYKANGHYGNDYEYEYCTSLETNNTLEISETRGNTIFHHSYKYDEEGNLSEYIVKEYDKLRTYFRWEYKYDNHKNWTEATKYKVTVGKDITFEEELDIITRNYEYYE